MTKLRSDLLLVRRGLAETRAKAQAAIAAGHVTSGDQPVTRPSDRLAVEAPLAVLAPAHPYVSRGGIKLAFALDHFGIDPAGTVALDLGASTGGFTDVLLRRGARRVYAVDVGHGQMSPMLAADERVVLLEGVNARSLSPSHIPERMDLTVCDLSFISLIVALPPLLDLAEPGSRLLALVKPQFEVGRAAVGKGGLVRDPAAREAARDRVAGWLAARPGWQVLGVIESPIAGGNGNIEYLLAAWRID